MTQQRIIKTFFTGAALSVLMGCSGSNSSITTNSPAEEIYGQHCSACHGGGFKGWMTGAPEVGDKAAWKPLLAKGVDAMTTFSIKGVNKMPVKGGCKTCTDEQIKATVEYMVGLH
jgi:cytochrome c5